MRRILTVLGAFFAFLLLHLVKLYILINKNSQIKQRLKKRDGDVIDMSSSIYLIRKFFHKYEKLMTSKKRYLIIKIDNNKGLRIKIEEFNEEGNTYKYLVLNVFPLCHLTIVYEGFDS